jgi:flagellar basal-body rod modification protein FlgD
MQIESNSAASSAANSATQSGTGSEAIQLPQQTLGQQDFLNLLVTQLQNQDPMNPMSDTDFVAQMAQFSTLSTMDTMQSNMAEQQANGLIGLTVGVNDTQGNLVTGTVTGVDVINGSPQLVINGETYGLSQLVSVTTPPAISATPASNTTAGTTSAN